VQAKRWGVAPTLALGLGSPTRATLAYLHVQQENRPDGGVSTFGLPGYVFGALQPGPAVDSSNFYGLDSDADNVKLDMLTTKIEHDLARDTTLRNTTRIGRTVEHLVITGVNAVTTPSADPATFLVTRTHQGRRQDNEILTNQTNLSTRLDTAGIKHSLSTGVELIYEYQRTETPLTVQGATADTGAASLYAPNAGDAFADPSYLGTYARGSTLTAAAYAFDTLALGERWLLNAGLRVDRFHTETNSATYTAASGATPASLVQNPQINLTDTLVSWKVGAVFKPADNGSVYAELSDSRQPPGGTNFALSSSATSQANAGTDPQEGTNIEFGTKWDLLDGRLAATGAVYRSENKNELVSDGLTPPTFTQVGKRRVQGVELGLVGQATDRLSLSAGFSYMDSKILRGSPTQQGGVIVFTPKLAFTSWATYKLPAGFTVGGGLRYVDSVARSSNTAAPTSNLLNTPSYWVADAMLGYEVSRNVALQLNLYNLFDKDYLASLNNGGSRYTPGAPRNALLTGTFKF
jgi:catecholate siderophore receptor